MRWSAVILGLVAAFTATALPAAGDEQSFFDGLNARMIGPYRGYSWQAVSPDLTRNDCQ